MKLGALNPVQLADDRSFLVRHGLKLCCHMAKSALTLHDKKWVRAMRFVVYATLGFAGGGMAGAIVGYYGVELPAWLKLMDRLCLEGKCHWTSLYFGLHGLIAGAVLGLVLGLWRAWLFRKQATAAAIQQRSRV